LLPRLACGLALFAAPRRVSPRQASDFLVATRKSPKKRFKPNLARQTCALFKTCAPRLACSARTVVPLKTEQVSTRSSTHQIAV
jgi:hypothetical protein